MEFIKNTNIDFLGMKKGTLFLSMTLVLLSIMVLIIKGGPILGVDFAGGILVQLKFDQPVQTHDIRAALEKNGLSSTGLQYFPKDNEIIINMKTSNISSEKISSTMKAIFKGAFPNNLMSVERVEMVGPVVSRRLIKQAILAVIFSSLAILGYVALRFKRGVWGLAAVIALMHDVFITLGIFSLYNKEITLTVLAAFLTLTGYSINDTIVVYDRVRENMRLRFKDSLYNVINTSINETLSRTIITGGTTFAAVLSLFFLGGKVIHNFAFVLLVGIIIGTYSSIFVASLIVYAWSVRQKKKR